MPGTVKYDFSGAVALVTGGARGQGFSHAQAFANAGARVVVFDVAEPAAPGIPYSLCDSTALDTARAKLPSGSLVLATDVRDDQQVREAMAQVEKEFGRLDILVNNAGVNTVAPMESATKDQWDTVMSINLWGAYACSKHCLPLMKQTGPGRIINISSLAAYLGGMNQVHYASSKAGLLGFTTSLALEVGMFGITVNAICPTLVISPQTIGLRKAGSAQPKAGAPAAMPYAIAGMSALESKDVTAAVLWLASDAARYVTGTALTLDGGRSIK